MKIILDRFNIGEPNHPVVILQCLVNINQKLTLVGIGSWKVFGVSRDIHDGLPNPGDCLLLSYHVVSPSPLIYTRKARMSRPLSVPRCLSINGVKQASVGSGEGEPPP